VKLEDDGLEFVSKTKLLLKSIGMIFSYFFVCFSFLKVTNIRVGQDLLEHQHRLAEEEATRKRNERLEQDIKSSKEKFEEVRRSYIYTIDVVLIYLIFFSIYSHRYRSFVIGKVHEQKRFHVNYTK
jgi:hypothetical protein